MKKLFISLLALGLATSATAADKIRFATEATYPPYEFTNAKNEIVGFDIDLANALCKEVQAECTFSNQAFDSLIPSLKFKRFDAVIAGMDVTPERQQQILFTDVYIKNSARFIVVKGKYSNMEELKGKKVGVQTGTTNQRYLNDKQKELEIKGYDSYQNAILDLKNGRLDVVFGDSVPVAEWLKANSDLTTIGDEVTDQDYFGSGIAIGVNIDNKELQEKLNSALAKIKADGSYEKIYDKWFK